MRDFRQIFGTRAVALRHPSDNEHWFMFTEFVCTKPVIRILGGSHCHRT